MGCMPDRVLIAGGGIGALEGLLAVQAVGRELVRVTLVCASPHLTYRALSVEEPFGAPPAGHVAWEHVARDRGVELVHDVVTAVRADRRTVEMRDGPPLRYDSLLLAVGAVPEPPLPGALPFAGQRDVAAVADAIRGLEPGRAHRMVFVAPTPVAWTLPLYELALLTARHARQWGLDLQIEIVTREDAPLGVFGREASGQVAQQLDRAGIALRTVAFATAFEDGKLWLELEGPIDADLVIALPALRGRALPGLPADEHGFTPVDPYCRVRGLDRVWAVGDMTTRPLKQGGLATQQADVAAEDIAARAGAKATVHPYEPFLRGLLLTGDEPLFLERRPHAPSGSRARTEFLWWPPHKIVGRHAVRYLEQVSADAGLRRG